MIEKSGGSSGDNRSRSRWDRTIGEERTRLRDEDGRYRRDANDRGEDQHRQQRRNRSRSPERSREFRKDREYERRRYDDGHSSKNTERMKDSTPAVEPDLTSSGLLAKESNQKNGIVLKYFEPPEARKAKEKWRLYVFPRGSKRESFVHHLSRQSCYLIGREASVADIHIDHASVSKQHCVVQFRNITSRDQYGKQQGVIKPFLIDLDSANGTSVNQRDIPSSRYYEIHSGDTITLGASTNDYVVLKED